MAERSKKAVNAFLKSWATREASSRPQIVKVSWLDACIHQGGSLYVQPGWRDGYQSGVFMETVGYLLSADKDWITVAMERNGETSQQFRDWQDIPRYSIAEIKVLDKGK